MESIKITLEATPEMIKIIDSLAVFSGTNRKEVIKRGISTLWAIRKGQFDGEEPAMIKDGKDVAKLTGF